MTRRFPVFESHAVATCFNCEGDLDGSHWSDSGNAPGQGQYRQSCEKCRMTTYYDLANRKGEKT